MTLVNGVEINTDWRGGEVHILGYGFSRDHQQLCEKLTEQRNHRAVRLRRMLEKLNSLGLGLDEKRVVELAGEGSVGRPHLALALMEKKLVFTVEEAFDRYLGYGKPGWVPRQYVTPRQAIQLVLEAGGIPVLAHPERGGKALVKELVGYGLKGLEVFYPKHTAPVIEELRALSRRYGLLETCGSDYHGINPDEKGPGSVEALPEVIETLNRTFG